MCVPTPLDEHRNPDLSFVVNTAETIAKHLRKCHLVVLESTTYPGTTDEVMLPILERGGLKAGKDFFLAFSPERENPGDPVYGVENTPKVVGGITKNCLLLADMLYSQVVARTVPLSSTRAAESTKLLENIFCCVNIALVNELKMIFDRMGIDVWEVIGAPATKPFGFMPFYVRKLKYRAEGIRGVLVVCLNERERLATRERRRLIRLLNSPHELAVGSVARVRRKCGNRRCGCLSGQGHP